MDEQTNQPVASPNQIKPAEHSQSAPVQAGQIKKQKRGGRIKSGELPKLQ
jgi:hypothetical protein